MSNLISRKMVTTIVAIAGVVSSLITALVVEPNLVNTEVFLTALGIIAALGGFNVYTQGKIDRTYGEALPEIADQPLSHTLNSVAGSNIDDGVEEIAEMISRVVPTPPPAPPPGFEEMAEMFRSQRGPSEVYDNTEVQ